MPVPGPPTPSYADQVIATQSPYWLNVNGAWLHLEGVAPGSQRSSERPSSDFVSVDGHRAVQQAPRAAREWALDWQYATPAAVAALSVAAEAPGEVWLFDAASARANMLDPRSCFGHDPAAPVIDCGVIGLRALDVGWSVTVPVRGGVVMTLACWSTVNAEDTAAQLEFPGGTHICNSAFPGRGTVTFTPTTDGDLTVYDGTEPGRTAGLQLVEGPAPSTWLAGERTPCKVAVGDPSRTLNLLRTGTQGRSDYSVTLREVG